MFSDAGVSGVHHRDKNGKKLLINARNVVAFDLIFLKASALKVHVHVV